MGGEEAEFVADESSVLVAGAPSLDYRDIAILYRTNSQSRALEESLRKRAIQDGILIQDSVDGAQF